MLKKKAFTLAELIVSIIIMSILVVIIFRIYIDINNISVRVENEKILNNEMLYLMQVLQNVADSNDINFSYYNSWSYDLIEHHWIVDNLNMIWEDWEIKIYLKWDCIDSVDDIKENECWVEMEKNWESFAVTDKDKIYVRKLYYKIIPYEDINDYWLDFENIKHNWIWMYWDFYVKRYNKHSWIFDVSMKVQTFFNIRKYN